MANKDLDVILRLESKLKELTSMRDKVQHDYEKDTKNYQQLQEANGKLQEELQLEKKLIEKEEKSLEKIDEVLQSSNEAIDKLTNVGLQFESALNEKLSSLKLQHI